MQAYQTIVVVHPGAIGDAVMGTPVPRSLKANFPNAKIVYLTHPSLFPLLELCGAIDVFIEWNRRTSLLDLVKEVKEHKPDLLIDLVGSARTRMICWLAPGRTLTYHKDRDARTWSHVVDNYLATLAPLELKEQPPLFPSLFPPPKLIAELRHDESLCNARPLIALVPGVGKHRPNRAWPVQRWIQLGERLLEMYGGMAVLVGGDDDEEVCRQVALGIGEHCLNLAGQMSLVQTTALLSMADAVVSADTGPAHLAAAVGKQVVCLMGPTDPLRTGPYRMETIGLSAGAACACTRAKRCLRNAGSSAGECMETIAVAQVLVKVAALLPLPDARLPQ